MSWTPAKCPCNPDKKKMQALAAILNPDTVGRDSKQENMLLFQSLENQTLGYDQFAVNGGEVDKQGEGGAVIGYYGNPDGWVPKLKFQSKLVTMLVNNIVSLPYE
jgi:hypothetical protein